MKKLMIAAAIVCAAVLSQAATASWASGNLYTAASASGGWSNTAIKDASALVTMSVYLIDGTDWSNDGVSSMTQAELYNYVSEKSATYTAQTKNASGTFLNAATARDQEFPGSTTFYSIIVAEYTDANYGDMFMAAAKSDTTPASGTKSISNIFGGLATATVGGVRNWQAVPEPTSGLLLLLGVAGLALKRKRA